MRLPFITSDFKRSVADSASLFLRNRYFEQNPSLATDGATLLARPGMRKWVTVGQGPVRGVYSEAGTFNNEVFVASYDQLYRVAHNGTNTLLYTGLYLPNTGVVNMAATAEIGTTPAFLFVADGRNLFVYTENGFATGTLTGTVANSDVVRIDSTYYRFTNASVNAGTPAGTEANPWLVAVGANSAESIQNLYKAINASGVAGTTYSTALTAHPSVIASFYSSNTVVVRAKLNGLAGNGIVTTETGVSLAWGAGTLAGGGSPSFTVVPTPDDVGVIDIAVINSYLIVIPAQDGAVNGRFYWIEPGETTIDPLNFATAERSPDGIQGVEVFGDQFWLSGTSTTEPWYVSGDPAAPMQPLRGVVFDRGTFGDTAKVVGEVLVVCDNNGGVFVISGGAPQRVSTPSIEEQIRKAIQFAQSQNLLS